MARMDDTRNEITGGVFFSAVIQGRDITVQLPPEITPALSGLPAEPRRSPAVTATCGSLMDILAPSPLAGTMASRHQALHQRPRWW